MKKNFFPCLVIVAAISTAFLSACPRSAYNLHGENAGFGFSMDVTINITIV